MEEEQRRMQSAVYDVLNDIDRRCLRKLQVKHLYLFKKMYNVKVRIYIEYVNMHICTNATVYDGQYIYIDILLS